MFGLSTLWIKAIAAALVVAALVAAYVGWAHHQQGIGRAEVQALWDKSEAARADQQREVEKMRRQASDKAAAGHEADKTAIQTKFVEVTKEVERVVNKIEYRDRVCLDDDGVRALNAAISTTGSPADTSQSGKPMPAASASQ